MWDRVIQPKFTINTKHYSSILSKNIKLLTLNVTSKKNQIKIYDLEASFELWGKYKYISN
jgi:hypothetical protein